MLINKLHCQLQRSPVTGTCCPINKADVESCVQPCKLPTSLRTDFRWIPTYNFWNGYPKNWLTEKKYWSKLLSRRVVQLRYYDGCAIKNGSNSIDAFYWWAEQSIRTVQYRCLKYSFECTSPLCWNSKHFYNFLVNHGFYVRCGTKYVVPWPWPLTSFI